MTKPRHHPELNLSLCRHSRWWKRSQWQRSVCRGRQTSWIWSNSFSADSAVTSFRESFSAVTPAWYASMTCRHQSKSVEHQSAGQHRCDAGGSASHHLVRLWLVDAVQDGSDGLQLVGQVFDFLLHLLAVAQRAQGLRGGGKQCCWEYSIKIIGLPISEVLLELLFFPLFSPVTHDYFG